MPVFYCDQEAKRIMAADVQLQAEIADLAGGTDRDTLRRYISQGAEYAARIDRLVWPRVAAAWEQFCQTYAVLEPTAETVVMECALLFESGFDALVDTTVLVTAPTSLRQQRVVLRDGLTPQQVSAIIALQLPDADKAQRATHVLSNDGTPADLLAAYLSFSH